MPTGLEPGKMTPLTFRPAVRRRVVSNSSPLSSYYKVHRELLFRAAAVFGGFLEKVHWCFAWNENVAGNIFLVGKVYNTYGILSRSVQRYFFNYFLNIL
ncbi:MAG: hypothetical protein FWF69_02740 [Firmicutes bacterium]|nr:hypothetical protein [Bacillota bacterium]